MIPNIHPKHIFKYTKFSFSESDVNIHKFSVEFYSGRSVKKRNSNFVGLLKIKDSLASFSLFIENSLLKGLQFHSLK